MLRISRAIIFPIALFQFCSAQPAQSIAIVYPNGGSNWPLFVAAEGGYYSKYGLSVTLLFGPNPAGTALLVSGRAQAVNYSLEQLMEVGSKGGSITLVSSLINRGSFALLAWDEIRNIQNLRGKRIGIGQFGDANYGYSAALLEKAGVSAHEVEWVPLGPAATARAAALLAHRVDAALLTAPAYFKLEGRQHIEMLANFMDRDDIYASTAVAVNERLAMQHPELVRRIIKANAEAVKRFYEDKPFAIRAFRHYNRTVEAADIGKLYDVYAKNRAFERIPYILSGAVAAAVEQETDPRIAAEMKSYDFYRVIDNSAVAHLVDEGFFERLFGPDIRNEEQRKGSLAFGRKIAAAH